MVGHGVLAATALCGCVAFPFDWSGSSLNDHSNLANLDVVADGSGEVAVYGTAGSRGNVAELELYGFDPNARLGLPIIIK